MEKVANKHLVKTKNEDESTPGIGLEPYKANIPDVASFY
jgi:hypothetical protein